MANQRETHELENHVDNFTQALATARKMQQDWLTYGLNFIHLYVEDVDGDWLETWEDGGIVDNSLLNTIKEFLISDDDVAVRVRQSLKERSLFDLAVNLEEYWRILKADERLSAVRNLLANNLSSEIDVDLLDLADSLSAKLAEIL